ncbi:MAG: hypothetical protein RL173_1024 [Fibrobacterota bacterium]|jgi:uncharacterized protein (DUF697 family)
MSTTEEIKEQTGAEPSTWESLKATLTNSILNSVGSAIESRSNFFSNPKNKKPEATDIPAIIASYSMKNAIISGGATIIPGPWGMAGSIPEIGMLMKNQISMIYDIGVAYGKEDCMSKELVAGIMMSSAGSIGGKLLIVQGERLIVKRVSLRAFQKAVELFGSRVLQQMLKSVISKWLPFVGALAMATWSNYSTKLIGRLAAELLNKKIDEVDESEADDSADDNSDAGITEPETPDAPPPQLHAALDKKRIRALISLMQIDQLKKPEERDFIISQIADTNLTEDDCLELIAMVNSDEQIILDPNEYTLDHDTAIGYINDMATLAAIDNELHPDEIKFITEFGTSQGVSPLDIQNQIDALTDEIELQQVEFTNQDAQESIATKKQTRKQKEVAPKSPEQIAQQQALVQAVIDTVLSDAKNIRRNDHGLAISVFRQTIRSIIDGTDINLVRQLRMKYQLNTTSSNNRIACYFFDSITSYWIQPDGTSGSAKNYIRHIDNDFLWRTR